MFKPLVNTRASILASGRRDSDPVPTRGEQQELPFDPPLDERPKAKRGGSKREPGT